MSVQCEICGKPCEPDLSGYYCSGECWLKLLEKANIETAIKEWKEIRKAAVEGNRIPFINKVKELGGDELLAEESSLNDVMTQIKNEITELEERL